MNFRFVFSSAPGIAAAVALGVSDVLVKIIAAAHCDVLTMLSFRGVVGLAGNAQEWGVRFNGTIPQQIVPDGPLTPDGSVTVRLLPLSGGPA